MSNLPTLPPSSDKDFWLGETSTIDVKDIRDTLCSEHQFEIDIPRRVVTCQKCGLSGRFTPSTIQLDDMKIKIKGAEHKVISIIS